PGGDRRRLRERARRGDLLDPLRAVAVVGGDPGAVCRPVGPLRVRREGIEPEKLSAACRFRAAAPRKETDDQPNDGELLAECQRVRSGVFSMVLEQFTSAARPDQPPHKSALASGRAIGYKA